MTLVNQENVYEATIGSGEAHTIHEWLDACFGLINVDWREYVSTIEGFTAEYPLLLSAPQTINSLGWRTSVSFHDLAALMMGLK
jgi:GDPmannose 4,6-dehydratase